MYSFYSMIFPLRQHFITLFYTLPINGDKGSNDDDGDSNDNGVDCDHGDFDCDW